MNFLSIQYLFMNFYLHANSPRHQSKDPESVIFEALVWWNIKILLKKGSVVKEVWKNMY